MKPRTFARDDKFVQRSTNPLYLNSLIPVPLLARRDRHRQPVLRRRQRAGGVRRIAAWRVVCVVEVERHRAAAGDTVTGQVGVEKPAGAIGSRRAGSVAEVEEQGPAFHRRLQPNGLPADLKLCISRGRRIRHLAKHVHDVQRLRRGERNPRGRYAQPGFRWIPLQPAKVHAGRRLGIFHPQIVAFSAMDDGHPHVSTHHLGGLSRIIRLQKALYRGLAIQKQTGRRSFLRRHKHDVPVMHPQHAEMRGHMLQLDLVARRGTEGAVAFLQPIQRHQREPAVLRRKLVGVRFPPVIHIHLLRRSRQRSQQKTSDGRGDNGKNTLRYRHHPSSLSKHWRAWHLLTRRFLRRASLSAPSASARTAAAERRSTYTTATHSTRVYPPEGLWLPRSSSSERTPHPAAMDSSAASN